MMISLYHFILFLDFYITIVLLQKYPEYDGATLYSIKCFNEQERQLLSSVQFKNDMFVFLNGITNEAGLPIHVIVKKADQSLFEDILISNGIQFTADNKIIQDALVPRSEDTESFFGTFNTYKAIEQWVETKLNLKQSNLQKVVIGRTFEGRDIVILKLPTRIPSESTSSVVILGGEEGRDWISHAVILKLLDSILENFKYLESLRNYYNIYFCPLLNPDGYEYSTFSRFWSKNRKTSPSNQSCIGVNVDRNWHLDSSKRSTFRCEGINIGERSLSEKETSSLAAYLNTIAPNLMAFINVRGFRSFITTPAYIKEHENNYPLMNEIMKTASQSFYKKFKKPYKYSASVMYNFTGNCADWVKSQLNIPIVYTIYMTHEDELIPQPDHVFPLAEQLSVYLEESLNFARNIYNPLFNSSFCNNICSKLELLLVILLIKMEKYFFYL